MYVVWHLADISILLFRYFLSRNESVSNIVSSFVPIFLLYFMKYLHEKPVVKGIHFLELVKCRLLKAESVLEIQPNSCAF